MQALNEPVYVIHGPVRRMNLVVIGHIVSHIHLRRLEDRRQPDNINAQGFDIVQLRDDARDVADPIAIRILE